MSEKDKFDEQADNIADCVLLRTGTLHPRLSSKIAAALRERGKQIADLRAELAKAQEARDSINSELILTIRKYKKQTHLLAEHISEADRLMSLWVKSEAEIGSLEKQIADLRADKEQLKRSLDNMNDCCLRAEAERDQMERTLLGKGYRRCDIPACNCNGWHYGNAEQRLAEIANEVYVNGQTVLDSVIKLKAERDQLKAQLAKTQSE